MSPLRQFLAKYPGRLILLYHSLWDPKAPSAATTNPARSLDAEVFEQQIEWLNEFAEFVSLDDLLRNPNPDRWKVAVTFDDGYRNNLDVGLPILKKYRVPMTWFVSTHFVLNPTVLPWWDLLDRAAVHLDGNLCLEEIGGGIVRLGTPNAQDQLYERLRHLFLDHDPRAETFRHELEARLNEAGDSLDNGIVSQAGLQNAVQSPWITVGGHTVHHVNMKAVSEERLVNEVRTGRRQLQEWTGQSVDWFAYPYGGENHRSFQAQQIVRQLGFKGAVTTDRGYVSDAPNRYELPRLTPPINGNTVAFRGAVSSMNLLGWLRQLKRRLLK